jgi:hypothetical protein
MVHSLTIKLETKEISNDVYNIHAWRRVLTESREFTTSAVQTVTPGTWRCPAEQLAIPPTSCVSLAPCLIGACLHIFQSDI